MLNKALLWILVVTFTLFSLLGAILLLIPDGAAKVIGAVFIVLFTPPVAVLSKRAMRQEEKLPTESPLAFIPIQPNGMRDKSYPPIAVAKEPLQRAE